MPSPKRKKLYYDVDINVPVVSPAIGVQVFTVTQSTPGATTNERYGAFLQDLPPLSANSPNESKRANAVSAWFQCSLETSLCTRPD
jgi:hypothetical protein